MIDRLLSWSLANRLAAVVLAVTLGAAGYYAYRNLTVEAFPDPTDTQVQVIAIFPGQPTEEVERRVSIPLERALNGTPGVSNVRSISLFGLSFDRLQGLAAHAQAVIAGVPGVADLGVVKAAATPSISVRLDRDALARYDLDMADVQDYVETALGGHVATELWEGEKKFDVVVRLPPGSRDDVSAIRELRLPLKDGALIPVSAIAEVKVDMGRGMVTRENGRRYVGIRMNVRGRDLGSFVAEAVAKLDGAVTLPVGYEMTWGGEFENQQRAMARLTLVLPLALAITFLLLFSSFGSVWDALMILLNVPFALLGGVLGLALAHMTLSVSAAVGFIALLGQAVLNGVLVVAAIRARRGRGEPLRDAVAGGANDRLRAVLMTALLASLGLVPAAMSHAIGSETQRPIAVVVVWGTISAAALTLVVLPVTYYWATLVRERVARRLRREIAPGAT